MSQEGQRRAEAALVRRCVHIRQGVAGTEYGGREYVAALQRLRVGAAVQAARRVEPFFWHHAPKMRVLLCADCSRDLGL